MRRCSRLPSSDRTTAERASTPAQQQVQAARSALARGDLAAARYHLGLAIAQAQQQQITH